MVQDIVSGGGFRVLGWEFRVQGWAAWWGVYVGVTITQGTL